MVYLSLASALVLGSAQVYAQNGNTKFGDFALYSNTTDNFNTASGFASLYFNTTGGSNTASGVSSLYSNTTGNNNTASGNSQSGLKDFRTTY